MPRIKRVILWEGNPNDLPNRKVKSNVVFSNTNNLGSKLMSGNLPILKESILLTNSLLIM